MPFNHYGFAQPFCGLMLVPLFVCILAPSGWIALGVLTGFGILIGIGDALARRRALGQVRRWAAALGIHDVQRCPRGGFVSWGWTLWTFAETGPYRGLAVDGSPQELLASYYAPGFGALVFTLCEIRTDVKQAVPSVQI